MQYLGTLGTLAVIYLFFILARLSEKLGSVEKMLPRYRYYYVAIFFLAVGLLAHVGAIRISLKPEQFPLWLTSPWFWLASYYAPMVLGVTIGLVVTWQYWSWLFATKNE